MEEKKRQGLEVLENKLKESKIPEDVQATILRTLAAQDAEFQNRVYANMESYVTTAPEIRVTFVQNALYRACLRDLFIKSGIHGTEHAAAILSALSGVSVTLPTRQ